MSMDTRGFTGRFDDCEVVFPDDPDFDALLPIGSAEIRRRARQWAREQGLALLVGVQGGCPHVLTSDVFFAKLMEASSEWSLGASRLYIHLTGGLHGKNDSACVFRESLDHCVFWVDSRWPTAPFMTWFPYGDPREHFPTSESSDYVEELMADPIGPQMGLSICVTSPDGSLGLDPRLHGWNWYGHGSYRVDAASAANLGAHEATVLKIAWETARLRSLVLSGRRKETLIV